MRGSFLTFLVFVSCAHRLGPSAIPTDRATASIQEIQATSPDDPRDAPFHESYFDPQNGCHQLTVFIQRPKGLVVLKGSPGHVAIGIDNHFYDFGPRVFAVSLSMVSGTPGSAYLQNYLKDFAWRNDKPKNKDLTVEEAYNFAGSGSPEYNTFVIPVSITTREARQIEGYWKNLYARIDNDRKLKLAALKEGQKYQEKVLYKALADQCATEAQNSLLQAGMIPAATGLTKIVPGFFGSFLIKNMRHTCGMNKGMAVSEAGVPLHPMSPERAVWGQEIPNSARDTR